MHPYALVILYALVLKTDTNPDIHLNIKELSALNVQLELEMHVKWNITLLWLQIIVKGPFYFIRTGMNLNMLYACLHNKSQKCVKMLYCTINAFGIEQTTHFGANSYEIGYALSCCSFINLILDIGLVTYGWY